MYLAWFCIVFSVDSMHKQLVLLLILLFKSHNHWQLTMDSLVKRLTICWNCTINPVNKPVKSDLQSLRNFYPVGVAEYALKRQAEFQKLEGENNAEEAIVFCCSFTSVCAAVKRQVEQTSLRGTQRIANRAIKCPLCVWLLWAILSDSLEPLCSCYLRLRVDERFPRFYCYGL